MVDPRRVHWVETKHVLRYLCGIVHYGLDYLRGDGVRLWAMQIQIGQDVSVT
jgi:hypothetical protein